jgi:hypothetical protein
MEGPQLLHGLVKLVGPTTVVTTLSATHSFTASGEPDLNKLTANSYDDDSNNSCIHINCDIYEYKIRGFW